MKSRLRLKRVIPLNWARTLVCPENVASSIMTTHYSVQVSCGLIFFPFSSKKTHKHRMLNFWTIKGRLLNIVWHQLLVRCCCAKRSVTKTINQEIVLEKSSPEIIFENEINGFTDVRGASVLHVLRRIISSTATNF